MILSEYAIGGIYMFKTPIFKGSCTAIVTPFNEGGIDYDKMAELIDFQYDNGTAALVGCGTTGENATMSTYEHEELIEFACRYNDKRMKIIAGVGSNDTQKALKFARCAFYLCCRPGRPSHDRIQCTVENEHRHKSQNI